MRRRSSGENLRLGASVVERLLPQRRPMLMVDAVRSFAPGPPPVLEAHRHVSLNEPFLEGHFDGLPVWPGVLTIEGLGQTCTLLMIVSELCRMAEDRGEGPESVLEELRNLDRGGRMHPGFRPERARDFLGSVDAFSDRVAVGAAVDVRLVNPVYPGSRIDYRVARVADVENLVRFEVEASCDGETVVRGTMTGAHIRLAGGGR